MLALPNVTIHEQCEVSGFVRDGEKVVGVQTSSGAIHGDQVVLTAGAWSGDLLKSLGLALLLDVAPRGRGLRGVVTGPGSRPSSSTMLTIWASIRLR